MKDIIVRLQACRDAQRAAVGTELNATQRLQGRVKANQLEQSITAFEKAMKVWKALRYIQAINQVQALTERVPDETNFDRPMLLRIQAD